MGKRAEALGKYRKQMYGEERRGRRRRWRVAVAEWRKINNEEEEYHLVIRRRKCRHPRRKKNTSSLFLSLSLAFLFIFYFGSVSRCPEVLKKMEMDQ